jgi:pSer/pThr/pTyr-binding forkhead associated (FHA) protein
MALVTLRVIDGADQGREFPEFPTPVTIGREEGNSIQLNDERISRFHLKIQEDEGKLVLTDLESTNGTKVNGETVQLALLRPGDVVAVGRTVLVVGTRWEIAKRLAALRKADLTGSVARDIDEGEESSSTFLFNLELDLGDDPEAQILLHTLTPPELPGPLSAGQTAQLAELLQYLHLRIRGLVQAVKVKGQAERVTLEQRQWQNLLDTHARLAAYLKKIGEP